MSDRSQSNPDSGLPQASEAARAPSGGAGLRSPRRSILAGIVVLLVAFGGVGTWAAVAPLDSAALAPGEVVVASDRKMVQAAIGGVVKEIAVRDGQMVATDELLIQIDAAEQRASFEAAAHQFDATLARRARLRAERDGAEEIDFPASLIHQAEQDPDVRAIVEAQRRQFRERRQSLRGRISIQRQKIAQLNDRIAGLKAERTGKRDQVDLLEEELVGLRELYEKGYYPRTRILAQQRRLAQLTGGIGATTARIATARNQISEAKLSIEQTRRQYRERIGEALAQLERRLADLRERVQVTGERLKRTAVRAPHGGEVQNMQVHTAGAVVESGQTIMQIVPTDDRLIVRARVAPRDIDVVSEGQTAEVRLTALAGGTTPSLTGRLVNLSADRLTRRRGQTVESYYEARIRIPRAELEKLGAQKLQAGMPVQVLIQTGEQTVLEYLARPITDALSRGFIGK